MHDYKYQPMLTSIDEADKFSEKFLPIVNRHLMNSLVQQFSPQAIP